MFTYGPPAGWNDFTGAYAPSASSFQKVWNSFIQGQFDQNIGALKKELSSTPLFFSGAYTAIPPGQAEAPVTWNGFPRRITLQNPDPTQWMPLADALQNLGNGLQFRPQDEYLEWRPVESNGKIIKFVFTAEAREYWTHLAKIDQRRVEDLYQQLCDDTSIKYDSLRTPTSFKLGPGEVYTRGDYNPWNPHNTNSGCVHLSHPANSIGAEINLAALATVQRIDANGQLISEPHRLSCCSDFGTPDRSSDPTIGQAVNLTVRGGVSVTLADPVGLYMGNIALSLANGPNGESVRDWWTITRGVDGRALRAEFAAPPGATFALGDVQVKGAPLRYGGQIAELITMVIYAQALKLNVADPAARTCENRCCIPIASVDPDNVLYDQIGISDDTPPGEKDAFPELKTRTVAGGIVSRLNVHRAENLV